MMSGDAKRQQTKRCAATGSLNVTLTDRTGHPVNVRYQKVFEKPMLFLV